MQLRSMSEGGIVRRDRTPGDDDTEGLDLSAFSGVRRLCRRVGGQLLTCSLPPSPQSLAASIPLSIQNECGREQPSLLLALPHRFDRAYHWGDFQLEWNAEDEEHFISLQANSSVLRVKGFGKGGAESKDLMIVAAKEYEGAADGAWGMVHLRTVIVESGIGSRTADRTPKIGAAVELEDLSLIQHVRWATEAEMNALSRAFYEEPTKLDKGDLYLTPIFRPPPGEAADWEEMTPRHDPFLFFSRLREALTQIEQDEYAEFLAISFVRNTEVLVVEKEYPGNTSGKASTKSKQEAQNLRDALEVAGTYIACHGLNPRSDLPNLGAPSDLVLLDFPSHLAARLGLKVGGKSPPSGKKKKPKTPKTPKTQPPKPRAAPARKKPSPAGSSVVSASQRVSELEDALEAEKTARAADAAAAAEKLRAVEQKHELAQREIRLLKRELSHVHNSWRTPFLQNETTLQGLIDDGMLSTDKRTVAKAKSTKLAKRPLEDREMESASPPRVTRQRSKSPPVRRPDE